MRTTLTLDDDVAAQLQAEARRRGLPFKTIVNDYLRAALARQQTIRQAKPFKVEPFNLGLREGLSYDDIEALIEAGEGPMHR